MRTGAPLREVEAAVAAAVADGEHSAATGRDILRRVRQLDAAATQQRAARGAAPRSPLLLRLPSSDAHGPAAVSAVSAPAALPVRTQDVVFGTSGSLGWARANRVVTSVQPYGQASAAGVEPGWEVTAVDGVGCFDGFDVDRLMQLAANRGQVQALQTI
jgi:hypothetical protein